MCGSFCALQARFEQVTRVGADAFHWDRRERVFERDIFRFGTATTSSPRQTRYILGWILAGPGGPL